MARSYNKLWHLLIERGMSKTQLRKAAGLSTNALAKLGKNESVSLKTLERICGILECKLEDILEYVNEEEAQDNEKK